MVESAYDFEDLSRNAHETWTLFAVQFRDHPGRGDLRAQHMVAHLAWLAEHAQHIRAAGSLRTTPESTPVGGLWVVRAPSREAVETLLQHDPFYTAGLRAGWDIYHWSKALPVPVSF